MPCSFTKSTQFYTRHCKSEKVEEAKALGWVDLVGSNKEGLEREKLLGGVVLGSNEEELGRAKALVGEGLNNSEPTTTLTPPTPPPPLSLLRRACLVSVLTAFVDVFLSSVYFCN